MDKLGPRRRCIPTDGRTTTVEPGRRTASEGAGLEATMDHALAAMDADPTAMSMMPNVRRPASYLAFAAPSPMWAAPPAKPTIAGQPDALPPNAFPAFMPSIAMLTNVSEPDAKAKSPVTNLSGSAFTVQSSYAG